ncbi:hypothetical protein M0802_011352 [Mischocyttarus mexicanus]|nr:hypothetical protein M0802_011352 [Mischocyttarus mexicanus]
MGHLRLRHSKIKIQSKNVIALFNEDIDIVYTSSGVDKVKINAKTGKALFSKKILKGCLRVYSAKSLGQSRLRHGLVQIIFQIVRALFNEDFHIILSRLSKDKAKYK